MSRAIGREPEMRCHLNRISHIVINVSDLEASLAFYETLTPLRRHTRTTARLQPFETLGIKEGAFDGYLLADGSSGQPGMSVQLIQWRTPKPSGAPYPTYSSRGLYRFCFLTSDVDGKYEQAVREGHEPFRPPQGHGVNVPGGSDGWSIVIHDPDGIPVQFTRRPNSWRDDLPDQLYHVNVVSGDIDGARRFLQDIVGLDYVKRLTLPEPIGPIGFGYGAPEGQFDAAFLRHRADHRYSIDVVDWFVPGVSGTPYTEATNIGIHRVGFEVDDLDAAVASLRRQGVDTSDPESWDLGDAGTRRVAIFQDPEGITYQLQEQLPYPDAREAPWPPEAFTDTERARSKATR